VTSVGTNTATATVAGRTNLSFTLAKLVPSTPFTSGGRTFAGEPSRWVSNLVTGPPTVAERTAAPASSAVTPMRVDIHSADLATLQTLPGVTKEVAAKLVSKRPYPTKAHLLTRKIVSEDVYDAIRKSIVARQPAAARGKRAAPAASQPL
jgi:DNA uptake protein ComE-like DNA-binding protein